MLEKKLIAQKKFGNQFDKFEIKVLNGKETVGHLSCKYWRTLEYFLVLDARAGLITVEVTGHCNTANSCVEEWKFCTV